MSQKIKNGALNRFYGFIFCSLAFISLLLPSTASEPVGLRELHIATTPVGASVFIDGKNKGRTPVTVTLPDAKPHLLDITKNGYNSVRRTVVINNGQKLPIDISLEPVLGLALIKSIPIGANIRINDIDRGKAPLLVTDLPIGTYRVHITAPGYLKQDLELVLKDRTPVAVNAELLSDSAGISVVSTPPGASVIIDGAVQGITPCEIAGFPGGECTLSVTLAGYAEYKRKFRLVAGKNEELNVALSPLPASLRVVTMPVGVKVYINGQFKGVAPLTLKKLTPGTYQIKTEMKGYDSLEKEVELNRGDNSVEEFMLLPNTGALEITSEPSNVKVFIDGKWSGLTTAKSNETDKVSEVLVLDKIPSGSHEIKFSMKGYFTKEITVDIERDKTVIQHVSLVRRFIPDCEVRTASEVYQGVLVQIGASGSIKLEIAPGVMKVITAAEVVSRKPLRVDVQE
jgi:hypothetical protein